MTQFHKPHSSDLAGIVGSMLVIVIVSGVSAQDRLNIGADVTFRALYSHDSNLYLTRDAKSDEFYTYAVNFGAGFGYDTAHIGFGGNVEDKHYERYTDQDDTSYDLNANASIGGEPFRFSVFSQHTHTIAPLDTTDVTLVESDTEKGGVIIEATPAYFFEIELAAYYEDRTFVGSDEYEYLRTGANISIYGMYDKHTRVGLRCFWGDHDYDDDIRYDTDITRVTAYAEHDHNGNLRTQVELGYETFKFQIPSWITANVENAEGLYAAASVRYVPNMSWELDARLKRSHELSYSANSYVNTKLETQFSVIYHPISRVRIEGGTYYIHTDEDMTFDNDTYGADLKVAYALSDWSELEFEYEYDERNTDSPGGDYDRHLVSIGLALRW
jgi:hypothetical protein